MKLPLYVHYDHYGKVLVADADRKVVCSFVESPGARKVAQTIVRKLNRSWRYRLFGTQPYVYTRADWLSERNVGIAAARKGGGLG